jgi:hypothetical protein
MLPLRRPDPRGDISTQAYDQMMRRTVVPDLRQRRISHKRDEWQVIADTLHNAVDLCEVTLSPRIQTYLICRSAVVTTNTGPGARYPLIVTLGDGSQRNYMDQEARILLWDHRCRIQAIQGGDDRTRLKIGWEYEV